MSQLFNNYNRRPVHLVKGEGTKVVDDTGKEYLDFTSGIAVVNLGHSHPAIVEAIQQQSQKLWHVSNLFESPEQQQLATSLMHDTQLNRAFFCNSGAEANEAAIKLARKHTGKHVIITFEQSFHGRTFGAMSATGQKKIQEGFGPLLETFRTIPFNDCETLESAIDDEVAAIMLEVIQGEGGVNEIDSVFCEKVMELCESKGILLILDEVQTGIGRTGTRYAYEQTILKPDIITLAKGLGGGFPIGAMLGTEALVDSFGPGTHGTTFGGGLLAVAVAQTVIDHVFQEDFLQMVQSSSEYIKNKLEQQLPELHFKIKGKGLLLGIHYEQPVHSLIKQAEEEGLLLVQAGDHVIRLLPPLVVTKQEIDQALEILIPLLLAETKKSLSLT
jgi:acetylornithine aminotransferase